MKSHQEQATFLLEIRTWSHMEKMSENSSTFTHYAGSATNCSPYSEVGSRQDYLAEFLSNL